MDNPEKPTTLDHALNWKCSPLSRLWPLNITCRELPPVALKNQAVPDCQVDFFWAAVASLPVTVLSPKLGGNCQSGIDVIAKAVVSIQAWRVAYLKNRTVILVKVR
jgi:hypothetical protein